MIYIGLFLFSVALTYAIKLYATKKDVLDIPNARSSHSRPTPKGGGLAIIVVFYIGLFYFKDSIDSTLFYALLCAIPIASISITQ